jgi:mannosyltransferase OCH1-like enzyme
MIGNKIPKVIYMCHETIDKMVEPAKVWTKLNPDYEIKLYDNKMCEDFLLNNYSEEHKNIFNYIQHGQIKADFWRACIINKFGGIYVDSDIMPLVPLNDYIENHIDFCTCISSMDKFNPQLIISKENDKILEEVINKYKNYYRENKPYDYWGWSICKILTIGNLHIDKTSRTCYYNGKKIQLLLEINTKKNLTLYCTYNNKRVLNNKFIT